MRDSHKRLEKLTVIYYFDQNITYREVVAMKSLHHLLIAGAFLAGFAGHATAKTYSVESELYNTGGGTIQGSFSGTMQLTGQITLDDSLPVLNVSTDIIAFIESYSINNGVNTFTESNSIVDQAEAITDAEGNVTSILIGIGPVPPVALNDLISGGFFDTSNGEIFGANDAPCIVVIADRCDDIDAGAATGFLNVIPVAISITEVSSPAPGPSPTGVRAIPTMATYGLILTITGLLVLGARRLTTPRKR